MLFHVCRLETLSHDRPSRSPSVCMKILISAASGSVLVRADRLFGSQAANVHTAPLQTSQSVQPTDGCWVQTSSNEVASSHLFPPQDGPGSAQLS